MSPTIRTSKKIPHGVFGRYAFTKVIQYPLSQNRIGHIAESGREVRMYLRKGKCMAPIIVSQIGARQGVNFITIRALKRSVCISDFTRSSDFAFMAFWVTDACPVKYPILQRIISPNTSPRTPKRRTRGSEKIPVAARNHPINITIGHSRMSNPNITRYQPVWTICIIAGSRYCVWSIRLLSIQNTYLSFQKKLTILFPIIVIHTYYTILIVYRSDEL